MRNTRRTRRSDGRAGYMARPRVPTDAQPRATLGRVTPDTAAGLYTCPECGGGAPLLPWRNVRSLVYAETPEERCDRLAAHPYGGTAVKRVHAADPIDRCPGSHGIPTELRRGA